jgi:hypothetical protein
MKNIKIIDNFLDNNYFKKIQSEILGSVFPWYYDDGVINYGDGYHQFIHLFYALNLPRSDYYHKLTPILDSLNVYSLIKSKANCLSKTENIIEHGMHVDLSDLKNNHESKTAILYMNTNNGHTRFQDGTIVNSIENRIVIFDSKIKHTGSTCTDQKIRTVINFNYF